MSSYARRVLPALVILSMMGCTSTDKADPAGSGIEVVATTTILADVATNIVGNDGVVSALLPLGADPHDYQASARQVAKIQTADLVIANGLGLEEGLEDVLAAAAADGANVVYVGDSIDPIPLDVAEGTDDDHGGLDPHFWLDPVRMVTAARLIGSELERLDPSVAWGERAEEYSTQLADLDQEIHDTLAVVSDPRRKLVVNHLSLGYFAARYEFAIIGTVIPGGATLGEPSSAQLSALVATIEEENVPAIFAETTESDQLADAVAAEVGREIAVVSLYTGSLGETESGADTLIGMLRTNATLVAEALS